MWWFIKGKPLLTNTHIKQSLIPSLNYLTNADLEREGLVAVQAETKQRPVNKTRNISN